MPVTTILKPTSGSFPAADIEACLRVELRNAIETEAALKGIALPRNEAELWVLSIQIDSLVVVDLLCALEPLLGFELSQDVVQTGGYDLINEAVVHLMPRIEKEWKKHKGEKK